LGQKINSIKLKLPFGAGGMKTSTILFSGICAITLGVQLLNTWGYRAAYQRETSTEHKSLLPLPTGHIRAIMGDSIQFEVYADSSKRGIYLIERSDDLNSVVDFKMRGDTLWVKPKVAHTPKFILYLPAVEVVMNKYGEVRYHSKQAQTLTAISQSNGEVVVVGGHYDELNVIASGEGRVSIEQKVKVETLNLNLTGEAVFNSSDLDCSIVNLGKIVASEKAKVLLTMNGKVISKLTKK
jgi:Putative auto-transporter adhesin, head GIN domain